jgi:8-oxo-dGTP pyrophosphatase MutT (NUDIX family)
MDLADKWKRMSSKIVGSFRIFSIREDRYQLPRHDREAPFYILESNDWVNVIPLTEAGEVILIRQFRFGTEEVTLEIPGGIVEAGHTPLQAARNELLEETGFQAEQWDYLGFVHPNPAFLNNRCHSFLARGVRKVAETRLEESEEIEVIKIPYEEIKNLIDKGTISHSLVICAFHFYGLRYS